MKDSAWDDPGFLNRFEKLVEYCGKKHRSYLKIIASTECFSKDYWSGVYRSLLLSESLIPPRVSYDKVSVAHEHSCAKCKKTIDQVIHEIFVELRKSRFHF